MKKAFSINGLAVSVGEFISLKLHKSGPPFILTQAGVGAKIARFSLPPLSTHFVTIPKSSEQTSHA